MQLAKRQLRDRGWTETMIRDLLGDPDATKPNPHSRAKGAPMALYESARVREAERTELFTERAAKAAKRSTSGKRVADRKRKETLAALEQVEVTANFPASLAAAQRRAVRHYNNRNMGDVAFEPASLNADDEFLQRITVNYLRHVCSSYEDTLQREAARFYGQVGARELYPQVRARVLAAIGDAFPQLRSECARQRLPEEGAQ